MNFTIMLKNIIRNDMSAVLAAVITLGLLLSITTPGFISFYNLDSIAATIAITTIVGLSQLTVLAIGHFNLALGPMGVLGGVCTGALMELLGVPIWISILAGLFVGTLAGAIQGVLIVKTGISPFIITLALASLFLGGITGITKAIYFGHLPQAFNHLGEARLYGVSLLLIIAILIICVLWIFYSRTPLGRQILSTGASQKASHFSGIPTNNVIIIAHAMSGFFAATAGILLAARLNSAQILIPTDWMLVSFAAPVLGGTLMSGGKVSVPGTIFGATLMTLINNTLILIGVNYYWYQSFLGAILLGAFALDRVRLAYVIQKKL